jgi:hypothetical protein
MRNLRRLGSIALLVIGIAVLAPSVQAERKASTEEQVAVLMKWYRTYFDEGKYRQAEQVAELAYDLAPDDPQIAVALKLARRQQTTAAANVEVEARLTQVLQRLDRMERQMRATAAKSRQRAILQIAQEPPGSPDSPVR